MEYFTDYFFNTVREMSKDDFKRFLCDVVMADNYHITKEELINLINEKL
jgi:hypothetical protein